MFIIIYLFSAENTTLATPSSTCKESPGTTCSTRSAWKKFRTSTDWVRNYFVFLKGADSRPLLLIFVLFTSQFKLKLKKAKRTCCAWDLNLGLQDSRGRRIHWAMAAAQLYKCFWCLKGKLTRISHPIKNCKYQNNAKRNLMNFWIGVGDVVVIVVDEDDDIPMKQSIHFILFTLIPVTQSESDRSCILLLRLQKQDGGWVWVHTVLQGQILKNFFSREIRDALRLIQTRCFHSGLC